MVYNGNDTENIRISQYRNRTSVPIRDSASISNLINNSDLIYDDEIDTSSELTDSLINSKLAMPRNVNEDLATSSSPVEDAIQSPLSINNISLDNINIHNAFDSIHQANNQVIFNSHPHSKHVSTSSIDSTNQQLNALIQQNQQNQQQILKYQNQLQQMQMKNSKIEKFYNSIQSPPDNTKYKTVTWYSRWASSKSPFLDKIVFHVKVNAKNEASLISTLKKKRNDAKANPDNNEKIVQFCNHLFKSMKYIENEQSDILNDAFKLLKKSCKENYIEACNILAKLYLHGIEGEYNHIPNYERAKSYFMKVLKNTPQKQFISEATYNETSYNLGICYENTDSDKKRSYALSFYKHAAINGHPGASFRMYKFYENISPKEAVKWLTLSKQNASKEFPDGLYEYALHSYKGFEEGGISKNKNYTITLLKEAADKFEHVHSALELGKYYLNTEGETSVSAGKYLHIAASKGNRIAQYKLANWWRMQPESMVKPDMKKKACYKWLVRSAEGKEGLLEAIYKVGCCYEIGYGIIKDKQKAQSYYGNAASKGYSKAKQRLEKMNKSI